MKRLYNLLPLLLVLICFASPGPHWDTAFADNKAGIEEPSVGHEEHSDLIVLFSRHADLTSSQSESSSESEAVAEFEERIRSKSNEDILWETFGLMAAMPDAPDDIKQFYGNALSGETFAEERRVREALMGWVPG